MTRVLVVEDEESFSDALTFMLERGGHEVAVAADLCAALEEFEKSGADILLLDLMLPESTWHRSIDRFEHALGADHHAHGEGMASRQSGRTRIGCRRLRPPNPSRHEKILARIRGGVATQRRVGKICCQRIEAGPVRMDVDRHVVTVRGERKVSMPMKEFDLLEILVRNSGRVLTRAQLIDRV